MRRRLALAVFALAAGIADGQQAQWPPPPGVEARMHELQGVLASRESTHGQREAAREELSGLLKSPAGQARGRTPDERPVRAARASIDPFPAIVKPAQGRTIGPAPPLAHLEIVAPPRPLVIPRSGSVATPANGFAIDPRTGAVLHEIPGGFIDPRTGQVTPR